MKAARILKIKILVKNDINNKDLLLSIMNIYLYFIVSLFFF